jgi:hypothetical protein
MEYDQRAIIRFLHNKRADAHDITQKLQAQFPQDACALRTVQFWIGELGRGRQDLYRENHMGRTPLDANILTTLDKSPFESAQSMAESLRIGLATVLRHLHNSIGFRSFHLHWVPHVLTVGLREK